MISSIETRAETTHSIYAKKALTEMYIDIADIYHDLQKYPAALSYYERYTEHDELYDAGQFPLYQSSSNNFVKAVNTYLKTENHTTAKKICDDRYLLETSEDDIYYKVFFDLKLPSFYQQLAEIFIEKRQLEEAKDCYQKCIGMAEGYANVRTAPNETDWNILTDAYIFMAGLPDTPPEKSAELLCSARDLFRD